MTGRTVFKQDYIRRQDLQNNPEKIYLFGDNVERKGLGGQAREMRGEPNAIGIPTKYYPSMDKGSFFSDDDYEGIIKILDASFKLIPRDKDIIIPSAGLGSGLARLSYCAPKVDEYLKLKLKDLKV